MESKDKKTIQYEERIQTLELEIQDYASSIKAKEKQVIQGYEQMDQMLKEVEEQRDVVKKKSDELQKANEFVSRISNTMDEVLIVLGMDGRIQNVNQKLLKLVGRREKEVLGEFPDFLFSSEDLELFREKYLAEKNDVPSIIHATFSSKRKFECKAHLLGKGEKPLIHLFRSSLLISPSGKKEGVVIIGTDIKELISTQNHLSSALSEVTALEKKIMASIRYAEKIQKTILPLEGRLRDLFPESFIMYYPKDIISGDFYWIEEDRDYKFVAIVDCTGHGVPGALLSMIGNMLLNEIVKHRKILEPGIILEELHREIRKVLQQGEDQGKMQDGMVQDGMDVCLCRMDKHSPNLFFAGAGRPLFVIQDGELRRIRGTRKSIGGRQKEEKRIFKTQTVSLNWGDKIYLMSDGYVDQGDAQGKKFGSKIFKSLLKSIGAERMEKQREILEQALEEHRQQEAQRDDITLMGIELTEPNVVS